MRTLVGGILLVVVHAILREDSGPSFCASPSFPQGQGNVKITVTSNSTCQADATWTPTGGESHSGSETGVEFTYDASSGDVTVTSMDKVQDLITKTGAPLQASQLTHFTFDGTTLYATDLDNYPLPPC